MLSEMQNDYRNVMFSRNRLVLGDVQFEKLFQSRVVVVGIGGVGSVVCEELVRLGVQNILYFARGHYEFGNVNRQIPATYITVTSRTPKVHALAERLHEINPQVKLELVQCDIANDIDLARSHIERFKPAVLFNCVDEIKAQAETAWTASEMDIPCIIGGVTGIGLEGIVSTFLPDGMSYLEAFPIDGLDHDQGDQEAKHNWLQFNRNELQVEVLEEYARREKTPYPVLTPLPWMVASIAVTEFVKLMLCYPECAVAPLAMHIAPFRNAIDMIDLRSTDTLEKYFPWRP